MWLIKRDVELLCLETGSLKSCSPVERCMCFLGGSCEIFSEAWPERLTLVVKEIGVGCSSEDLS